MACGIHDWERRESVGWGGVTSELFSLGIMVFMVPCLGVNMEAQKSLRNSGFCLAWQRTGSTIITVQFPAPSDMLGGNRKGLRRSVRQLAFPRTPRRPTPPLSRTHSQRSLVSSPRSSPGVAVGTRSVSVLLGWNFSDQPHRCNTYIQQKTSQSSLG